MLIDAKKCIGCGQCTYYCPVKAIKVDAELKKARIDVDECVECGTCLRMADCPKGAIYMPDLSWPRSLASMLSDPITEIRETQLAGRGTEEMKTNEITGRLKPGQVGFAIDVGRPYVGTTFTDVEIICKELIKHNVVFEPKNPVTILMKNKTTGEMRDDVKRVRVVTAVIECVAEEDKTVDILNSLKIVASRINTVFGLNVIGLLQDSYCLPLLDAVHKAGLVEAPNGKVNLGLGRANS